MAHTRKTGYVLENQQYQHIAVAERAVGHTLPKGAIVHHVDGNPSNNEPNNLVILQNQKEHKQLHRRERIQEAGGNPFSESICGACSCVYSNAERTKTSSYCRACRAEASRKSRRRIKLST